MPEDVLRIDSRDDDQVARWAAKLDVSREQLLEALRAVGDRAADVELHLKGTRASVDADEQARADAATGGEPGR